MMISLTELTDQPALSVSIDGREYSFSELPIACLARLQAFLQTKVPHPLEAIKPHLAGLDPEDRGRLLESARQDAKEWPPDLETAKGKIALLSTDAGQVETLFQGLTVHQPNITREQARKLFKVLEREAAFEARRAKNEGRKYDGESTIQRIYAVLFGLPAVFDDEGLPHLKVNTSQTNGSPGTSSSDVVSANSG